MKVFELSPYKIGLFHSISKGKPVPSINKPSNHTRIVSLSNMHLQPMLILQRRLNQKIIGKVDFPQEITIIKCIKGSYKLFEPLFYHMFSRFKVCHFLYYFSLWLLYWYDRDFLRLMLFFHPSDFKIIFQCNIFFTGFFSLVRLLSLDIWLSASFFFFWYMNWYLLVHQRLGRWFYRVNIEYVI